jgi:hypothetical protein
MGSTGNQLAGRTHALTDLALFIGGPVLLRHRLTLLKHLYIGVGVQNKLNKISRHLRGNV